jgi:predicted ribonuclease YlaK
MSEGSKLIIMGDLNQRDETIAKEKTGLFTFINDRQVKDSSFTASVHMLKSERGEVSALFSNVFEPA